MRFQFILSHIESGQSLEVSEPDGWKNSALKLEEHEDYHSLIEYFDGSFIFYGDNGEKNGGLHFIKALVRDYGIDTTIVYQISLTFDEFTFHDVFDGQLAITDAEEMPDNKLRIPIIRDDFWSKFIARKDTPVDIQSALDLDDQQTALSQEVNLKLESQIINKTTRYQGNEDIGGYDFSDGVEMGEAGGDPGTVDEVITLWTQGTTALEISEIKDSFELPTVFQDTEPLIDIINIAEESGEVTLTWKFRFQFYFALTYNPASSASTTIYYVRSDTELYYRINEGALQLLQLTGDEHIFPVQTLVGGVNEFVDALLNIETQGTQIINIAAGDRIFFYAKHNITFRYTKGDESFDESTWISRSVEGSILDFSGSGEAPFVNFSFKSVFRKTNGSGFLLHDVGAAITDRVIGELDTFYSKYLGGLLTQARQYAENGCAWAYALIKGLQLRQYSLTEKPFFLSFNQWWKGADPILGLSLCYDIVDGNPVIRVEKRNYTKDISEGTSLDFSSVRQITRKYDNNIIYNKVEIGYARWQAEDVGGIDDPQTKRTYATRFKKVGKGIQIYSEFIAASLAIETTRRQTRIKSADYKFDNETFIIALNPDLQEESPDVSPDLLQFIPELDENFTSITGLLNSETRYNLRLTPARNFLRHQASLQGCLQDYLGSEFKFVGGEGNYDMTSEMIEQSPDCSNEDYEGNVLDEKGNIVVTDDFLHLTDLYEADIPMEWDEYNTIRNNRRKPIGISLTDEDHVPMFIKTLSYRPVKGSATVLMWAKEYLDLSVIEDTAATQECYVIEVCEDALTDELGDILTDQLGVCLTD